MSDPSKPTTIERAFQIARGGRCRSVVEIGEQLRREGFSDVQAHLGGFSIRRQLKDAMRTLEAQTHNV